MPTKDGTAASGGKSLTGEGTRDGLTPSAGGGNVFVADGIASEFELSDPVASGQEASVHVYRNGLHLILMADPAQRVTMDTYWIVGTTLALGAPPRAGNVIYASTIP